MRPASPGDTREGVVRGAATRTGRHASGADAITSPSDHVERVVMLPPVAHSRPQSRHQVGVMPPVSLAEQLVHVLVGPEIEHLLLIG